MEGAVMKFEKYFPPHPTKDEKLREIKRGIYNVCVITKTAKDENTVLKFKIDDVWVSERNIVVKVKDDSELGTILLDDGGNILKERNFKEMDGDNEQVESEGGGE
jgi:hypothetical protein